MEYYAGLDVSLRSCALCIVDTKGNMLFECELPCEADDIADCLSGLSYGIERVGFEAGTMSQHLYFGLTAKGFDVVCMEARQVNVALSAMRNKTDKNDARGIAQVLRRAPQSVGQLLCMFKSGRDFGCQNRPNSFSSKSAFSGSVQ